MRRRDPVLLAWVVGLALAALVYLVGPDRFLFRLVDTAHVLAWRLGEAVADLSVLALDLVRALAIGLFATFVVLAVAVSRRGGRGRGALLLVTVLFLFLAGGAADSASPNTRWTAALLLSGMGALVMTGRLRQAGALVPR
jgi:hypothetical protein